MKICTTIGQSQKLIELGIDRNTADMCWQNNEFPVGFNDEDAVPAWSLSALLELFDDKTGIAKEYGMWFAYDNGKSHCDRHCDNPLDAVFEMVCWFLKTE